MKAFRLGGISIFWQTFLLLVGSLLVSQLVIISIILLSPRPRPNFFRMSEVAEILSEVDDGAGLNSTAPIAGSFVHRVAAIPQRPTGLAENGALRDDLARRLKINREKVRLYFKPDQNGIFPFAVKEPGDVVPRRLGEPIFFNKALAARDTGNGWLVMEMTDGPRMDAWQRDAILTFGAISLLLLAISWFFARRLSRPIRQFALSADKLGRDSAAPQVPIIGPSELRTTAIALNAMHKRIEDYLRERTAMIAAIAHDLRTPLARIAFRVEGSSNSIREPVMDDINQMRDMISATMSFAKMSGPPRTMQPVSLMALLTEMVRKEREMGQDVRLEESDEIALSGDLVALRRLFQNLIDNALSFGGGAELSVERRDDFAYVSISDSGPGLPEDKVEAVFDPFVRIDPSRSRKTGGVGLGLTIARSIAADHGGTVTLRNRKPAGLTALVTLPVVSDATRNDASIHRTTQENQK